MLSLRGGGTIVLGDLIVVVLVRLVLAVLMMKLGVREHVWEEVIVRAMMMMLDVLELLRLGCLS